MWDQEEVSHLTRSRRYFKPFELERDHPRREIDKENGVIVLEEEEEDCVLKYLKKTQANITVWILLIAFKCWDCALKLLLCD